MTGPAPASGFVWTLIAVLGVSTYAMRLSFIQLYGWMDVFPPSVERGLSFVPPAILAALVFPALFALGGSPVGVQVTARTVAGGAAAVVAWRTESMTATIAVGMAVLWGLRFLPG